MWKYSSVYDNIKRQSASSVQADKDEALARVDVLLGVVVDTAIGILERVIMLPQQLPKNFRRACVYLRSVFKCHRKTTDCPILMRLSLGLCQRTRSCRNGIGGEAPCICSRTPARLGSEAVGLVPASLT
jgi:hypothetical protein